AFPNPDDPQVRIANPLQREVDDCLQMTKSWRKQLQMARTMCTALERLVVQPIGMGTVEHVRTSTILQGALTSRAGVIKGDGGNSSFLPVSSALSPAPVEVILSTSPALTSPNSPGNTDGLTQATNLPPPTTTLVVPLQSSGPYYIVTQGKYQENGDTLSDFVNLVCQEAQNSNTSSQVLYFNSFELSL
ncbi:hypothetical protein JTE90_022922, partial [Oedothorax gibbosus]